MALVILQDSLFGGNNSSDHKQRQTFWMTKTYIANFKKAGDHHNGIDISNLAVQADWELKNTKTKLSM